MMKPKLSSILGAIFYFFLFGRRRKLLLGAIVTGKCWCSRNLSDDENLNMSSMVVARFMLPLLEWAVLARSSD